MRIFIRGWQSIRGFYDIIIKIFLGKKLTSSINKYTDQLFRLLLLIIIIFISSDIFLTIELSGATIRLSYILFSVIFILSILL